MTTSIDLGGLSVALATPFTDGGELDLPALARLARHVVAGGARALVALGTTGEASVLDEGERDAVVETVRGVLAEGAPGRARALLVVGTGSNATRRAAAWTARAQALGADAALVVTPYYNRPNPAGLVAHYRAVAEAAPGLPLVLYNVPGRTGLNVTPPVLARLWELPAVVAVKESSGNLAQIGEVCRACPAGKQVLSGDDALGLASIAAGAVGLVSVAGNVAPRGMADLVAHALAGRREDALALQRRLLPLMDALFLESNPIPLKAALRLLGLAGGALRLPLAPAEPATVARLEAALEAAGARQGVPA